MAWNPTTFAPGQPDFAANLNDVVAQVAVLREAPVLPEYPEYGAAGNGVDDDTDAVQAALDSGKPVLLTGAYKTTASLEAGDGARITGQGDGRIVLAADSDTHGIVNADQSGGNTDIEIRSVVIVGPEDGTLATAPGSKTGRGIYLSHVTDARVLDCDVSRFGLQGICFEVVTGGRIAGCSVTAIKEGNAISLDAGTVDVVVIANPRLSAADCAIGVHHKSDRIAIVANTVENTVFGRGIDWYGALSGTISANVLKNVGGTGSSGHGILIYPSDPAVIADEYEGTPAGLALEGNIILAPANDGIQVLGNQATAITDLSIRGGVITGPGGVGVRLARKVSRATIATHVYGAGSDGVLLEAASGDIPSLVSVDGLFATGCTGYGLRANSSVGVSGFARLRGNTAGSISVPLGNNVLYDTADGYLQMDSGLTVRDLYAASLNLSLHGIGFTAEAAAGVANNTLFKDTADGKLKFKDNGGTAQALY